MRRLSCAALLLTCLASAPARAQEEIPRVVEVEFTPVRRAQIAVWLERADGTFMRTLALTQATALRGIGNRPGASQMNSGFNWPYGRREGVLPVWAHRRAAAPGAMRFPRVIFQDRTSEGWASRSSNDFSRDDYYCLSFSQEVSSIDNLDAVSCPSVFNSDKGRYLTDADVAAGYAEPFQTAPGVASMRPLDRTSLYPPRRDVTRCTGAGCYDHPDVDRFAADARAVMPEIDAVTIATPPHMTPTRISFTLPGDWEDGEYVAWVEVNTEGDYNDAWGPSRFPTPVNPEGSWDFWAMTYGYPFRGQPSVVFRIPFTVGGAAVSAGVADPWGYGSIHGDEPAAHEMDGSISNDPVAEPGSGADRLILTGGRRVRVTVIGPEVCADNDAPGEVTGLLVTEFSERRNAHRFAHLSFRAAADDVGVARYEVRVAQHPITDEASFMRAHPANAATLEREALVVPAGATAGELVEVDLGGLSAESRFFVAVRAVDRCNVGGPIAATEFVTPPIEFTTVSPCFVATAAFGTPLASEIGSLRRFRDRHMRTNAPGRALVEVYETVGPHLAAVIGADDSLRAWARAALRPLIRLAQLLD